MHEPWLVAVAVAQCNQLRSQANWTQISDPNGRFSFRLHPAFDWSSWTMPVASNAETVASQRLGLGGGQLWKGSL